jgi:hypothetical protein
MSFISLYDMSFFEAALFGSVSHLNRSWSAFMSLFLHFGGLKFSFTGHLLCPGWPPDGTDRRLSTSHSYILLASVFRTPYCLLTVQKFSVILDTTLMLFLAPVGIFCDC